MIDLHCEWCGDHLEPPKTRACKPAHRAEIHRYLNDHPHAKTPTWDGSPLHGRRGESKRANASQARRRKPSGVQLAYFRTHRLLVSRLNLSPDTATALLKDALSTKQRERLEARER